MKNKIPSPLEGIYLAGIASTDITPPTGGPLAGFPGRGKHSSVGVYHPLNAVAVAIDDGENEVLLVGADWIGFYDRTERIRERMAQATGIDEDNIILNGTHTHCGPAVRKLDFERHGVMDHDYLDRVVNSFADLALKAWKDKEPMRLEAGQGTSDLSMSRRRPDPDNPGKILRTLLPNPDGACDHEIGILAFYPQVGIKPRGIFFNYAAHPTCMSGLRIGGDYPGFACDYLHNHFIEAQACFLQGCGGDQKIRPADPKSDVFGIRDVEQLKGAGSELGRAVQKAIMDGLAPVTGPLKIGQKEIPLKTEPLDEDLIDQFLKNEKTHPVDLRWARYFKNRLDKGKAIERTVPFEIQTLSFGNDVALIGMSGEMSVEYGLELKRDLSEAYRLVIPLGYCNNVQGYIAAQSQFEEYGYEVWDANLLWLRTGRYEHDTQERIHNTAKALLNK